MQNQTYSIHGWTINTGVLQRFQAFFRDNMPDIPLNNPASGDCHCDISVYPHSHIPKHQDRFPDSAYEIHRAMDRYHLHLPYTSRNSGCRIKCQ